MKNGLFEVLVTGAARRYWLGGAAVVIVMAIGAVIVYLFGVPNERLIATAVFIFLITLAVAFGILIGGKIAPPVQTDPWFKSYQPSIVGIIVPTVTLFAAFLAWTAVQRQIANQQEIFQAQQRPWISIVTTTVESPLTWEEKGARVLIGTTIKNVGKSAAFDIAIEAHQFVIGPNNYDRSIVLSNFCAELKQKQIARTANGQKGEVLFPGETLPGRHGLLFARTDVERGPQSMGIPFFAAIVLICVDYRSFVTEKRHTTGLVYELLKRPIQPGEFPKLLTPNEVNTSKYDWTRPRPSRQHC